MFNVEVLNSRNAYSMRPRMAQHYVLANEGLTISPLLKLCVAIASDLPEVAERHFAEAFFQYFVAIKAYDNTWGTVIPESFRADVATLRDRFSRKKPKRRTDGED